MAKNQRFLSSGVAALDKLLGGGIPVGSLTIIEEDADARYAKILGKYYLAEGVVGKESIFVATANENAEKMLSELPALSTDRDEPRNELADDEMKIAWRYSNLGKVDSSFDTRNNKNYDLSRPIDKELLNSAVKFLWKCPKTENLSYECNIAYDDLLRDIQNQIVHHKEKNEYLRIYIESLGDPFWEIFQKSDCSHQRGFEALRKFIYCLRTITRQSTAMILVTIPPQLFDNYDRVLNLRHSADTVVRLESFAGTERENIPALRDYHGFFIIPKLPKLHTFVSNLSTVDLVFKLRRKKFVIEKLHLPPELQESSEREQDDSLSCSSAAKKNLDF